MRPKPKNWNYWGEWNKGIIRSKQEIRKMVLTRKVLGNYTAWNKGLTKENDIRLLAISGENNGNWKVNPSEETGRKRAWYKFRIPKPCEKCNSTYRIHRHHKDHNTGNNSVFNIQWLCTRHHKEAHGYHLR